MIRPVFLGKLGERRIEKHNRKEGVEGRKEKKTREKKKERNKKERKETRGGKEDELDIIKHISLHTNCNFIPANAQ